MTFLFLVPAFLFGILLGNYTTTLLFRMPRGIETCGINKTHSKPPCCSSCFHPLKFYEYLPLLSWIFSRFKCNYCGAKINPNYFILEASTAFASVVLCYFLSYSESYLLLILLFATSILSGLIHLENDGKVYCDLTTFSIILGIVYRTLADQSILPFLFDLSITSIILISILKSDKIYKSFYRRELTHLFLQASVWVGFDLLIFLILLIIYTSSAKKFHRYRFFNTTIVLCCCTLLNICLKYFC